MTAPTPTLLVSGLRTQGKVYELGSGSGPVLQLRAQVLEAWDAIRIDAHPSASVKSLKHLALNELYPDVRNDDQYVVKLHGWRSWMRTPRFHPPGRRMDRSFSSPTAVGNR